MEELLRTCVGSESKLNTSVDKLAQLIATEFQRMSLGQEDKMRELPISNQRLQTELHLIKTEFTSKLNDDCDTKQHLEQELELSRRERRKNVRG